MSHTVCLVWSIPCGTETQPKFLQTQAFLSSWGFSFCYYYKVCRLFFPSVFKTETINEFQCSWNGGKVQVVSRLSLYRNLKKYPTEFPGGWHHFAANQQHRQTVDEFFTCFNTHFRTRNLILIWKLCSTEFPDTLWPKWKCLFLKTYENANSLFFFSSWKMNFLFCVWWKLLLGKRHRTADSIWN